MFKFSVKPDNISKTALVLAEKQFFNSGSDNNVYSNQNSNFVELSKS